MNEDAKKPHDVPASSLGSRGVRAVMPPDKKRRNMWLGIFMSVVVAGLCVLTYYWFVFLETHVATDDAEIENNTFQANARINGYIGKVLVNEGEEVKAGQEIAQIDQTDFNMELSFKEMKLNKARVDYRRAETLHASQAMSDYDFENAEANVKTAEIDAEATKLKLKYTHILAPSEGYVAKRSILPGQYIQPGQTLFVIVDNDHPWVRANFKETQVEHLKVGQPVQVKVDGYPHQMVTGTIEKILPSSGAKLSIMPPENATGNFTKIVQRIPVDITISVPPGVVLRPGMSVDVTVDTTAEQKAMAHSTAEHQADK